MFESQSQKRSVNLPSLTRRAASPALASDSEHALLKTRDYFVSKLQEHGLWDWFLSKFAKPDGSWEHRHGYDTGWQFSDSPPAIWYQQNRSCGPARAWDDGPRVSRQHRPRRPAHGGLHALDRFHRAHHPKARKDSSRSMAKVCPHCRRAGQMTTLFSLDALRANPS